MTDEPIYTDPDFARFYDRANGWGDDLSFCLNWVRGADSVLDLGCGTGWMLSELPDEVEGVGVDSAAAMLDIARARKRGARHTWVEGDVRTIDLGRTFHRIVMTGHAFQCFLTDEDRLAALQGIARHLDPDRGRFILDTRNPDDRAWERWTSDAWQKTFDDPDFGSMTTWVEGRMEPGTDIVGYWTYYRQDRTGETRRTHACIAFPALDTVKQLLGEAGLRGEDFYGDWTGTFSYDGCPDIIIAGRLKPS